MIRLETVEDFEKLSKILKDPNSKPYQYCIKTFGYCTACKTLTEYEGNYASQGCSETCLRCKRFFEQYLGERDLRSHDNHTYYSDPEEYRWVYGNFETRLKELHSREFQLRVFKSKVNEYKKVLKKESRALNSKIRRLAKLEA